jgi:hypothetical protein
MLSRRRARLQGAPRSSRGRTAPLPSIQLSYTLQTQTAGDVLPPQSRNRQTLSVREPNSRATTVRPCCRRSRQFSRGDRLLRWPDRQPRGDRRRRRDASGEARPAPARRATTPSPWSYETGGHINGVRWCPRHQMLEQQPTLPEVQFPFRKAFCARRQRHGPGLEVLQDHGENAGRPGSGTWTTAASSRGSACVDRTVRALAG